MSATEPLQISNTGDRRRWMALLAKASVEDLESGWAALSDRPRYEFLRPPETGLVMIRGRAGGTGQPFNMGEMTVTRCAVKLAAGSVGHGYVAGRNRRHAELAAVFDGLMQCGEHRPMLDESLLDSIEKKLASSHREAAAKTAATRVDFFTLVRGEDEC